MPEKIYSDKAVDINTGKHYMYLRSALTKCQLM